MAAGPIQERKRSNVNVSAFHGVTVTIQCSKCPSVYVSCRCYRPLWWTGQEGQRDGVVGAVPTGWSSG